LRGNGNQAGTCFVQGTSDALQSFQLYIAVRSPDTAVETDHQGASSQQSG
jgi:hypothetical protein